MKWNQILQIRLFAALYAPTSELYVRFIDDRAFAKMQLKMAMEFKLNTECREH